MAENAPAPPTATATTDVSVDVSVTVGHPATSRWNKPACPLCGMKRDSIVLTPCQHRVCVTCIRKHVATEIAEGAVSPTCPWRLKVHWRQRSDPQAGEFCGVAVDVPLIKRLVDRNARLALEANCAERLGDYARECPSCSAFVECPGPDVSDCVCPTCSTAFCSKHGRLHPYSTCAAYEQYQAEEDAKKVVIQLSSACPDCHAHSEMHGCNFVLCTGCGVDFCHLCHHAVTDTITHYGPSGALPCRERYIDDDRGNGRDSVWTAYLAFCDYDQSANEMKVVIVLLAVLVLPVAMVLAIPTAPCWWYSNRHESLWIAYVSATQFNVGMLLYGFFCCLPEIAA